MDASSRPERRFVQRLSGHTLEAVRLRCDSFEAVCATVHDVSIVGIGMRTKTRIEPGSFVMLEPAEAWRKLSPELKAEVRYARKDGDDYTIGCRLCRFLTTDDVMALGE